MYLTSYMVYRVFVYGMVCVCGVYGVCMGCVEYDVWCVYVKCPLTVDAVSRAE